MDKQLKFSRTMRIVFSFVLLPSGGFLLLLDAPGTIGIIISKLGLAFIVAGVVSLFRELVILRLEIVESGEKIADLVFKNISKISNRASGLIVAENIRRGYHGYYDWITTSKPQKLFFAGRSIFHRIQFDLSNLKLGKCEEQVLRKLQEGSEIKILILNPLSDLIDRLAQEENREPNDVLQNLSISFKIIYAIYNLAINAKLPPSASLCIKLYNEVPYFAYHKVDERMLIGFYFASSLVSTSSVYVVNDEYSKQHFEAHFSYLYLQAETLLTINGHSSNNYFNEELYNKVKAHFKSSLGK